MSGLSKKASFSKRAIRSFVNGTRHASKGHPCRAPSGNISPTLGYSLANHNFLFRFFFNSPCFHKFNNESSFYSRSDTSVNFSKHLRPINTLSSSSTTLPPSSSSLSLLPSLSSSLLPTQHVEKVTDVQVNTDKLAWQRLPPVSLKRTLKNFPTENLLGIRSKFENGEVFCDIPKNVKPVYSNVGANDGGAKQTSSIGSMHASKVERFPNDWAKNQCGDVSVNAIQWIAKCYPDIPRSFLQKLFRKRLVRIERFEMERPRFRKISATERLKEGEVICLPQSINLSTRFNDHETRASRNRKNVTNKGNKEKKLLTKYRENDSSLKKSRITKKDEKWIQRCVVYKDSEIVVLDKPPGLAVQGGTNVKKSLNSLLSGLCFENSEEPKLVHRLDKDTSGLMLLSRNNLSARLLSSMIKDRTLSADNDNDGLTHKESDMIFNKVYWALVFGTPKKKYGRINAPLAKIIINDGKSDKIIIAGKHGEDTKLEKQIAITDYKVLATSDTGISWLELKPLTGRKHQLRVHCASALGTPVVGDFKYGAWAHRKWADILQCFNYAPFNALSNPSQAAMAGTSNSGGNSDSIVSSETQSAPLATSSSISLGDVQISDSVSKSIDSETSAGPGKTIDFVHPQDTNLRKLRRLKQQRLQTKARVLRDTMDNSYVSFSDNEYAVSNLSVIGNGQGKDGQGQGQNEVIQGFVPSQRSCSVGSVMDEVPKLHLHCRWLSVPDLKHFRSAQDPDLSPCKAIGNGPQLKFTAEPPPHMLASIMMLKYQLS